MWHTVGNFCKNHLLSLFFCQLKHVMSRQSDSKIYGEMPQNHWEMTPKYGEMIPNYGEMTQNLWGHDSKLWGNEAKYYGESPQRQSEYTPMTMTMTMTNAFREHIQRAILKYCDL